MTTEQNSSSTRMYNYSTEINSPEALDPSPLPSTTFHDGASQAGEAAGTPRAFLPFQTPPPPGAAVYAPAAAVSSTLNPRSCVTCRKRKVRCDKHMPCSNCRRAQISCVFPAPGRAPRRPRPKENHPADKQPSSEREVELMKRLRKLENIVEELSGQVELEAVRQSSSAAQSPENMMTTDTDSRVAGRPSTAFGSGGSSGSRGQGFQTANVGTPSGGGTRASSLASSSSPSTPAVHHGSFKPLERTVSSDVHKSLGRLVLNDKGRSRYVSSEIWAKINDEIDHLRAATRTISDEESDESDHETPLSIETADASSALAHQSFIFGYSSANVDLRHLHPLPSQIPFMWQIYQENVDTIVKILHVPTMNKLIRDIRINLDRLTPSVEALMFSVYYGTVTSMEAAEVKQTLGAEKSFLLARYRFAFEQALSRANFLIDPDLAVCQAFVLFLILVRRHDKTRYTWTLTSLAVRSCQAIGLHRDGANFPNLTPFEVEMRRRLFWCLSILDIRSAEDQGTDPMLVDGTFDTKFPTNINDADFGPDITEPPQPRNGATDMTFSLMRFEICSAMKQFSAESLATPPTALDNMAKLLEDREAHLLDVYRRLENQYLSDSLSQENPMYLMSANITRIIVAKMIMVIYQPVLFAGPMDSLSCRTRNRLFIAAVEILEYTNLTNADTRFKHWSWLFRTYTPWHVMAYILLDISSRPWGPSLERAWTALNANFTGPNGLSLQEVSDHTAVWLPFKKLFYRAKKHRDAEITRLRADSAAALQLDLDDRTCVPASTFGTDYLRGSATSAAWRERWRKLINAPPPPTQVEQSLSLNCPHEQPDLPLQPVAPTYPVFGQAALPPPPPTPSSLPETTSTPTSLQPQPQGNFDKLFADVMSSSHFDPTQFFPIAFGGDVSQPIARDSMFGYSTTDLPRHDHTIGAGPSSLVAAAVPSTPLSSNDNPPAWLWRTDPALAVNQPLEFPSPSEDLDVTMDDGLDWENWQNTIRDWAGTGLNGVAGGVWDNGI